MVAVLGTLLAGGVHVRERVAESNRATEAAGLVKQVLKADTAQVPGIVDSMKDYRRWVDPALREATREMPGRGRPRNFTPALPSCRWMPPRSHRCTTGCSLPAPEVSASAP